MKGGGEDREEGGIKEAASPDPVGTGGEGKEDGGEGRTPKQERTRLRRKEQGEKKGKGEKAGRGKVQVAKQPTVLHDYSGQPIGRWHT